MKKNILLLSAALFLVMSSASYSETLHGESQGFGGPVSVVLTVEAGKITSAKITGSGETPEIGGAAIPKLEGQVVSSNGPEIDGVTGATATSTAVKKAVSRAMGIELPEEPAPKLTAQPQAPAKIIPIDGGLQIGQVYTIAHGTKCFTEAVAVVKDDTVIAAYLDDFQFLPKAPELSGVPNSDNDFGKNYADGVILVSKRGSADYYSGMMRRGANATVPINQNFDAIQNFAAGKTIDELEAAAGMTNAADAVSGATLQDTANYLKAIALAAREAKGTQAVDYKGDSGSLKLKVMLGAAHGTKCFTTAAALTDGERIILSWIDDFQFLPKVPEVTGVPNSDSDFGNGYASGVVMASKRINAEYYSGMMRKGANATVKIDANFNAIQSQLNGMTITDAERLAGQENVIDAVSGATLQDTGNYIALIARTAKQ